MDDSPVSRSSATPRPLASLMNMPVAAAAKTTPMMAVFLDKPLCVWVTEVLSSSSGVGWSGTAATFLVHKHCRQISGSMRAKQPRCRTLAFGTCDRIGPPLSRTDAGQAEMDSVLPPGQVVELQDLAIGGRQADLEPVNLAEPAFTFGLGDPVEEVVADLDQSRVLRGVGPEHRTPDTSFRSRL